VRPGVRLAVDVGSVRIGLARCDPDGVLAVPVATLSPEQALEAIARAVRDWDAIEVLVGFPLRLDGRPGPAALAARHYAEVIARRVAPVDVRLVDERLSTVTATRALRDAGRRQRQARSVVDQAAAVVVLQAALDAERATGSPPGSPVPLGDAQTEPGSASGTGGSGAVVDP
jgi:putative Holliday junction resolvase